MKPLIVLLVVFGISVLITRLTAGQAAWGLSARIAMVAMLLFTALGHFKFTQGMAMMLPDFIPNKAGIIYLTGIIEVAAAVGLLIPGVINVTGWMLILFFIMVLPANIYAAVNHIDYEMGTTSGNGPSYLWFRIPLQILFIVWVYWSACAA